MKAKKRHWHGGNRRRLAGGKRSRGVSQPWGPLAGVEGYEGGFSAATKAGKGDMTCVYSALKHSQFWLYHSGRNAFLLILRPGCW